jgi:hypothetical protein
VYEKLDNFSKIFDGFVWSFKHLFIARFRRFRIPVRGKKIAASPFFRKKGGSSTVHPLSSSAEYNNMIRQRLLDIQDLKAQVFQHPDRETRIEDMMMQAPVLVVLQGPLPELFPVSRLRVHGQVVELKDLGQMGQIILADRALMILDKMLERRYRPFMVKRPFLVRQHKDEMAARLQNAQPFGHRPERVRNMLETVAGKDKIIAAVLDAGQHHGVADELASRPPALGVPVLACAFPDSPLPYRLGAEVASVELFYDRIDRYQPPFAEDLRGAAELQSFIPFQT